MKKSLLFNKVTKYWLYFIAIYILAASLIIEGNIYFLLFNILGLCITIYLSSYYTYKETKNRSSSSKMLKIYSFIFIVLVFLATSVFRGHHLSLNFKNWNSGNINLIPLTNTIADLKTIFIDKNYTNLNLLLGNIFLLVPLLYLYPRNIKNNNFFKTTLACFLTSFLLETFQFIFGVGQFDIDDIILNTMGSVIFYPLFNKGSISKIMDNIFYFKKEKITKNDYIVLGLASVFFLCLFYILIYDYWFKKPGYGISFFKETDCISNKIYATEDDYYRYYYACSNNDDLYIEYTEDFLGFDVTKKYKITDIIAGKIDKSFLKSKDYLDNDYIIKENKYSSLKVDALKDDELTFKLDNTNIKLQGYNVAIANTTAEFNYFIIPNKEGQTIIDFTLLSKETNEERHLKYQVTVNEDLAVNYEKIN
mgnify:CR=1 FL=1